MARALAFFLSIGHRIDFLNGGSAVLGGDVIQVLGTKWAGVVVRDTAASVEGAAYIQGVFRVNKNTSDAFVAGEEVQWDISANEAVNEASIDGDFFIGLATKIAGASDADVEVLLNADVDPGTA